jgi:nucleotide-binding universal stress UspA family protein
MTGNVYSPSFRRVLCAVDLSQHSRAALYLAAGLTFARGCRLIVLLVDDRAGDDREREAAQLELQDFVRTTLPGAPGYREGLDCIVKGGPVADTVMAAAAEHHADALVVGSRGRSAVSRALFGSTTTALVRGKIACEIVRNGRSVVAVVPE